MYYLSDLCYICLQNKRKLHEFKESDRSNITYYQKIITLVPELDKKRQNNFKHVCDVCSQILEIMYEFRMKCIRNMEIFESYLNHLRSHSKISGQINVVLNDFKNNPYIKQDICGEDSENISNGPVAQSISVEENTAQVILKTEVVADDMLQGEQVAQGMFEHEHVVQTTVEDECVTRGMVEDNNTIQEMLQDETEDKGNENNEEQNRKENIEDAGKTDSGNYIEEIEVDEESLIKIKDEEDQEEVDDPNDEDYIDEEMELDEESLSTIKVEEGVLPEATAVAPERIEDDDDDGTEENKVLRYIDPRNYIQCTICRKAFAAVCNLKIHMRSHTGERPFQCEFCNKTFIHSSHLKDHVRLHTGEKPFKCNVCDKRFSQSTHLRKHTRIHTGENPYKCDVCQRTFRYLPTFRNHKLHCLSSGFELQLWS